MKAWVESFNGVLDGVAARLKERGQLADNYHSADVFILWQDVRGVCKDLADIAKNQLGKPVVVMQHGRGATRDYAAPNSFELAADRLLVWGESEAERMKRLGLGHRVNVVGCPLFSDLKPKNKNRDGRNILFAPVIADMEQPENILVYAALKKWESEKLIESVYEKMAKMKMGWATEETKVQPDGRVWQKNVVHRIPRNIVYDRGMVNVKLTPVHDQFQYMAPIIMSGQGGAGHIATTVDALRNTDVLVCLEEGTMQLLACALDIPVIVVDIFKYGNYGGTADYDRVEKISSNAVYRTTNLNKVGDMIDHAMKNPGELRKSRIAICEREGGAHLGDPIENAIKAVESVVKEHSLVAA